MLLLLVTSASHDPRSNVLNSQHQRNGRSDCAGGKTFIIKESCDAEHMQTQPAYNSDVGWPNNENDRYRSNLPPRALIISRRVATKSYACERSFIRS
jgi:hypothetical protein